MATITKGALAPISANAGVSPSFDDLIITTCACSVSWSGPRELLEAEGLVPVGTSWPSGRHAATTWHAAGFTFILQRARRPRGMGSVGSAGDFWEAARFLPQSMVGGALAHERRRIRGDEFARFMAACTAPAKVEGRSHA